MKLRQRFLRDRLNSLVLVANCLGETGSSAFVPKPAGYRFYHTHVRAGSDLNAGHYTGLVGPVYIEPKSNPGNYDREVFLTLKEFQPTFSRGGDMDMDFLSPAATVKDLKDSGESAMKASLAKGSPHGFEVGYDAFTINTILFLEDLGYCPKGEGGRFVASGAIDPGGALNVNTNGGGLSRVHPGMYGLFLIVEAVTQLRGQAGERQVEAEIALCHGNGGTLASQAPAILGTQATL